MKRIVVILALIFIAPAAWSQQQFVFTNYLLNEYYYNPALAGSEDIHRANIGYRRQWTGFDGAPQTLYANFYGSAKNLSLLNIGQNRIGSKCKYSFELRLSPENHRLFTPGIWSQTGLFAIQYQTI